MEELKRGHAPRTQTINKQDTPHITFPSTSFFAFVYGTMSYSKPTSGKNSLKALRKRGRCWEELGTFLVNLEIDGNGNGNGGHNNEVYEEERQEIKQKIIEIYNQLSDEQKDC